jgi:hypothetical protein
VPVPGPHLADNGAVELAVTAEARALIAAGWAPTSPGGWGWAVAFEGSRDGMLLRVVVAFDDDLDGGGLRRELAWSDLDRSRLDGRRARTTLADPDGRIVLVESPCVEAYFDPVVVEAEARGAAATRLVGKTLHEADDVDNALVLDSGDVTFDLRDGGQPRWLVVDLDPRGAVIGAQVWKVRSYKDTDGRYPRLGALRRATRGAVTAIETAAESQVTLVTAHGKFTDELPGCT